MLKQSLSRPNSPDHAVPLNLSSILIVESDPELRDSMRLLLSPSTSSSCGERVYGSLRLAHR
jgi:hypothetical protein